MNTSSRVLGLLALIGLIAVPVAVSALELRTGDAPMHAQGQVIADDLYMFGGSVTSAGTVRGDLVAGGGTILVSGPVSGDIAIGGGNITILSDIGDDARIAGGTIVFQGAVRGDVLIGGGQVTLGGNVGGDILGGVGTITINAPVNGDIQLSGGDVRINSTVGGNLDIKADKVTLGPNARVLGDFKYSSPKAATIEEGARISGETAYTQTKDKKEGTRNAVLAVLSIWLLVKVLMVFVAALIIGYFLKRFSSEVVHRAAGNWLSQLGRGLVFVIVTPILSIILLFTVIGIPFGVLGLLAFIAMLVFGSIITPIVVGSVLYKWMFKTQGYEISWKTILLGVLVYNIVGLIPFVGWLATAIAFLIAIGASMSIKTEEIKKWR